MDENKCTKEEVTLSNVESRQQQILNKIDDLLKYINATSDILFFGGEHPSKCEDSKDCITPNNRFEVMLSVFEKMEKTLNRIDSQITKINTFAAVEKCCEDKSNDKVREM